MNKFTVKAFAANLNPEVEVQVRIHYGKALEMLKAKDLIYSKYKDNLVTDFNLYNRGRDFITMSIL